jgi:carbon-monoxide dehydrogenase small subunit
VAEVTITVNGTRYVRDVPERTLLVEFLRDELDLTGTHVGCDTSQCGACVVHLDGASVKACTTFAMQAEGREVTTIEGLAQEGDDGDGAPPKLHPLQSAFRECHALQCGFCTPGMIMSAAELLQHNPDPSETDIRHWLKGNLCRCTGYHNIVRAIESAAETMRAQTIADTGIDPEALADDGAVSDV